MQRLLQYGEDPATYPLIHMVVKRTAAERPEMHKWTQVQEEGPADKAVLDANARHRASVVKAEQRRQIKNSLMWLRETVRQPLDINTNRSPTPRLLINFIIILATWRTHGRLKLKLLPHASGCPAFALLLQRSLAGLCCMPEVAWAAASCCSVLVVQSEGLGATAQATADPPC